MTVAAPVMVSQVRLPQGHFAAVRSRGEVHAAAAVVDRPFALGADSLLGRLLGFRVVPHYPDLARSRVEATVVRYDGDEAATVFAELMEGSGLDGEISSPITPMASDGGERVLDAAFWDAADPQALDVDERRVRTELDRHIERLSSGAVVLDPACSTGACLAAIGRRRPDLRLVGYDVSEPMLKVAHERLGDMGQLSKHDAREPFDVRADLCVVRCATHTVLTRADADVVLDNCVAALTDGAELFLTGATAPHHISDDLTGRNLKVLQRIALDPVRQELFPFYRARRVPSSQ